jgi:hypothetical protein
MDIQNLENKQKLQVALTLLHTLIEKATEDDQQFKAQKLKNHKALEATGESFQLFHLKGLREILLNLQRDL